MAPKIGLCHIWLKKKNLFKLWQILSTHSGMTKALKIMRSLTLKFFICQIKVCFFLSIDNVNVTLYRTPLTYDVVCNFWSDGTQDGFVLYLIEVKKKMFKIWQILFTEQIENDWSFGNGEVSHLEILYIPIIKVCLIFFFWSIDNVNVTIYHMPLTYDVVCNFWSDDTPRWVCAIFDWKKKCLKYDKFYPPGQIENDRSFGNDEVSHHENFHMPNKSLFF